jgi:hypothetical protein
VIQSELFDRSSSSTKSRIAFGVGRGLYPSSDSAFKMMNPDLEGLAAGCEKVEAFTG